MPLSRSALVAAATIVAAWLPLAAQQSTQATDERIVPLVAGRVIDADSSKPIAAAVVSIGGRGSSMTRTISVLSTGDGYFVFRNVPEGHYTIRATKSGYVDGAYGRQRPSGPTKELVVSAGDKRADLSIPMWKYAVISGSLVDEAGEPLVNGWVHAFRASTWNGRTYRVRAGGGKVDDRGVYRIANLIPGTYLVGSQNTTGATPEAAIDTLNALNQQNDPRGTTLEAQLREAGDPPAPGSDPLRFDGFVFSKGNTENGFANVPPIVKDGRLWVYPTTYYPAASSMARAQLVTLRSGEEKTIDIQLLPVRTATVSGTLVGLDGPAAFTAVHLLEATEGYAAAPTIPANEIAATVTDARGAFTFLGVTPADYALDVIRTPEPTTTITTTIVRDGTPQSSTLSLPPGMRPAPSAEPMLWAHERLGVAERDISGLTVTLRSGLHISGRMEFDGSAPQPNGDSLGALSVHIEPANRVPTSLMDRPVVDERGRFTSPGYPGGRYYVRIDFAPAGWMLKSVMYQGQDLSDVPIELTSDITGVVVTFTDRASQITGTVRDENDAADPMVGVIAFTTDQTQWIASGLNSRRVRGGRLAPNGSYTVALPPGEYYMVAVKDMTIQDSYDAKMLETLVPIATIVRLDEGEKKTVDLRSKPAPR